MYSNIQNLKRLKLSYQRYSSSKHVKKETCYDAAKENSVHCDAIMGIRNLEGPEFSLLRYFHQVSIFTFFDDDYR